MKNLLIAIFQYLYNEKKEVILVDDIEEGDKYEGIQIIIIVFHFYNLFNFSSVRRVFWKPFKKVISEEALPSLLENNKKGSSPYVNVWFELEESMEKFNLYSVKIENKVKVNSSMNYVLNNLFEKHKKRSK